MNSNELTAVAEFSRSAKTDELLDRVTAFRRDHDPNALSLFEKELARRGIGRDEIETCDAKIRETLVIRADGSAVPCTFCDRPAEGRVWAWQRLRGKVPLFPRPMAVCGNHADGRL